MPEGPIERLASGPRMELKGSLNMRDLLSDKGTKFEIDDAGWTQFDADSSDEEESLYSMDSMMDDPAYIKKSITLTGSILNFDKLEKDMKSIHDTGLVKKKILREGSGVRIEPDAKVFVKYAAFADGKSSPFDEVTRKPRGFFLENEDTVVGFRLGIQSMEVGEIAQIMVYPDLAYGELGCPPRIPRGARIIFNIEVVNFVKKEFFDDIYHKSAHERNSLPFDDIYACAISCNQNGAACYSGRDFKGALKWFTWGIMVLEEYSTLNEEDNEKRDGYIPKLCTNKAQTLLKMRQFGKVCIVCRLGLRTATDELQQAKLLIRFSKAKFGLQSYDDASRLAKKAELILRDLGGDVSELVELLARIDQKQKLRRKQDALEERLLCQLMFGAKPKPSSVDRCSRISADLNDKDMKLATEGGIDDFNPY